MLRLLQGEIKYLFIILPLMFVPFGTEIFETPKYFLLGLVSLSVLFAIKYLKIDYFSFTSIAFYFFILFNLISSFQINFYESMVGFNLQPYNSLLFYLVLLILFIFFTQVKIDFKKAEIYLLAGIFISAVIGILQFLAGRFALIDNSWFFDGRIVSTFGHPNILASAIVVTLLLTEKFRLGFVRLILILCLLLTLSKTAIILYFVYEYSKFLKKTYLINKKIGLTLILVSLLFTSSIFLGLFSKSYTDRIVNNPENYQIQRFLMFLNPTDLYGDLRFKMWEIGFNAFLDSPILGFGKGQVFNVLYDDTSFFEKQNLILTSTHNLYLDIAIESGILGLTSFLFFVVSVLRNSYQVNKSLFHSLVFIFIYSFFDITSVFLWFMIVFIAGISVNKNYLSYLKQF